MELLGDQLIRDSGVAVFELVKNAYDADAADCWVTISDVTGPGEASIVIEDDGTGMSIETVTSVWLELGTAFRADQKRDGVRSAKGRLPLGEKGVGRFAVHKLGDRVKLITRAANRNEVVVDLNWVELFGTDGYLADVVIPVAERQPVRFVGERTGTRIEITALREPWTRGRVRELRRAVLSICSPYDGVTSSSGFRAHLNLDPDPAGWLSGLLEVDDILELAIYRGHGTIKGSTITYDYEFLPLPGMRARLEPRRVLGQVCTAMGSLPAARDEAASRARVPEGPVSVGDVGLVGFHFYVFDREPLVLDLATADKAGLKQFLDANGGIRVYRDGVRVYDFGEPGNDWLGLGGRRVNIPVKRIGNNQILGAVMLDGEASYSALIEKTNREGFIENDAYAALREAVLSALSQIEAERKIDQEHLRRVYSRGTPTAPVTEELCELRRKLGQRDLLDEFGPIVDRVERQYIEVRDSLLTAAGAGLSLTVVLHEVEKIVAEAVSAVDGNADKGTIAQLVHRLSETVDGLSFLVRRRGRTRERASVLIRQALFNFEWRFRAHQVVVSNGMNGGDPDFELVCVRRLAVAAITNLLDNSIYWLDTRGGDKQIYIGTTCDLPEGPAIVVADNGPGFRPQDAPEDLVQPFFSRKQDGMGLGLYIASEVAKAHGGHVLFPGADDISLPSELTGAVVALCFAVESPAGDD